LSLPISAARLPSASRGPIATPSSFSGMSESTERSAASRSASGALTTGTTSCGNSLLPASEIAEMSLAPLMSMRYRRLCSGVGVSSTPMPRLSRSSTMNSLSDTAVIALSPMLRPWLVAEKSSSVIGSIALSVAMLSSGYAYCAVLAPLIGSNSTMRTQRLRRPSLFSPSSTSGSCSTA
jgi:hypothetical protein